MKKAIIFSVLFVIVCVLSSCQNSKNSSDDNVAIQQDCISIDYEAQYIRTFDAQAKVKYPSAVIIHSKEELNTYYQQNKDYFDLERSNKADWYYADYTLGFLDACDKYQEDFFKDKALVLVLLQEPSSSITHKVTDVKANDSQLLIIHIQNTSMYGNEAIGTWHIFVAVDKEFIPENTDDIKIDYTYTD